MASAGFYLLAGPLIGIAVVILAMLAGALLDGGADLGITLFVIPVFIFFGYIFGAVPAAITGLLVGWYRHRLLRWQHVLIAGLAGAAVSTTCLTAFFYWAESPRRPGLEAGFFERMGGAWILAIPGFVAALLCAWWQLRGNRLHHAPPGETEAESTPR